MTDLTGRYLPDEAGSTESSGFATLGFAIAGYAQIEE